MGFYVVRLTFTLFFILLCYICLELSVLNKKYSFLEKSNLVRIPSMILILGWMVYGIISYGPFE